MTTFPLALAVLGAPPRAVPDGGANRRVTDDNCFWRASVASSWSGSPPVVPGWTWVKSTEIRRSGPNGNTGIQVDHEYKGSGRVSCLLDALGLGGSTTCPPSVALCLEPPPKGSCGCGNLSAGEQDRHGNEPAQGAVSLAGSLWV